MHIIMLHTSHKDISTPPSTRSTPSILFYILENYFYARLFRIHINVSKPQYTQHILNNILYFGELFLCQSISYPYQCR